MSKAEKLREAYFEHGLGYVEINPVKIGEMDDGSLVKSYRNEVKGRARALAPIVCPTLSEDDIAPCFSPEDADRLFSVIPKSKYKEVSRRALEFEMTPPVHYWETAYNDYREVMSNTLTGLVKNGGGEDPPGLERASERMVEMTDMLISKHEDGESLVGDFSSIKAFVDMASESDLPITADDRETLASHAIMHSRLMNRDIRSFEKEATRLPAAAESTVDMVRAAHIQPEVMMRVRAFDEAGEGEIIGQMSDYQQIATTAIAAQAGSVKFGATPVEGASASLTEEAPSRMKSLQKTMKDLDAEEGVGLSHLNKRRKVNEEIFAMSPLGHAHQVDLIPLEISASRHEGREKSLAALLSKKRNNRGRGC